MWITEKENGKGTRYTYHERFQDKETGKWTIVSLTLNSKKQKVQEEARKMLLAKYQRKAAGSVKKSVLLRKTLTMEALFKEWVEATAPMVKYQTADNHKYLARTYLSLLPPGILLQDFTPAIAEKAINTLYYVQLRSYVYAKSVLNVMKNTMRYAKKADYIDEIGDYLEIRLKRRPVTPDELEKADNKFLTHEELKDCLKQVRGMNERIGLAMEFMSLTGLRCGELLAIRKKDINLTGKFIKVTGSIVRRTPKGESYKRDTPKNIYSYRTVILNERAVDILKWFITDNKRLAAWGKRYKDIGYIFTGDTGRPIDYHCICRILDRVEIPGKHITSHIFRHTHISMLAEMNLPLKAVMQRVGHHNPNTTLQIYTHVTDEMNREMSRKLETLSI